jgi:molecular chaperone Hsp33
VRTLLGEMAAAGVLMQSNIKFDGSLELQVQGDGAVRLAVVEVQSDLRFRATAQVDGVVHDGDGLQALLNPRRGARCAITLDPRRAGTQRYQGIVPLFDEGGQPLATLAAVLEHYMRQSEQLQTRLWLGADDTLAAGLLLQRLPASPERPVDAADEDFGRIVHLASTLQRDELLGLDAETLLRRLFWQEPLRRFEPSRPRFACRCARERVAAMLRGLGRDEVDSIVAERGEVEVGCEFCGARYRFDPIDAQRLFIPQADQPPAVGVVN